MQYRITGKKKDGSLVVSFRYWLNKQLKTVPAASIPPFKTEAEVILYMPLLEAKHDSQKQNRLKKESFHDRYYNFVGLVDIYKTYAKEKAPRVWKGKIARLENYVLKFFLLEKRLDNLDLWFPHFIEFRLWLTKAKSWKDDNKTLAPNTINHIIIELNIFLEFMAKLGNCKMQPKCDFLLGAKEDSKKGLDSVFSDVEKEEVYEYLKLNKNEIMADAFWLLCNTGMRISEFRGIGPSNVRIGVIPQPNLNSLIKNSGLPDYHCYIFFSSQVEGRITIRDEKEGIVYIPLKGKRKISPEHTRFVPIFDSKSFQIIKKYMAIAKQDFNDNKLGPNINQYSFFYDEVSSTILNKAFEDFYSENTHYFKKSTHDCRHTFATNLGNFDITGTLQEYICGHQKESAKRYNHLKQQLLEKTKLKTDDEFSGWN